MASGPRDPAHKSTGVPLAANKSLVVMLKDEIIKPINKNNLLYHYLPLNGAICYSAMSINVMNPTLFSDYLPKKDITNILLIGSVGGIGLYISRRPHLQTLTGSEQKIYSTFGALMFTFGSVLIWAIMRSVIPENAAVGSACGIVSAAGLLKCGTSYCNAIDKQIAQP